MAEKSGFVTQEGEIFFSSPQHPVMPRGPHSLQSSGYWRPFSGV